MAHIEMIASISMERNLFIRSPISMVLSKYVFIVIHPLSKISAKIQQFFGLDKINWKNCVIWRTGSAFSFKIAIFRTDTIVDSTTVTRWKINGKNLTYTPKIFPFNEPLMGFNGGEAGEDACAPEHFCAAKVLLFFSNMQMNTKCQCYKCYKCYKLQPNTNYMLILNS